jgi:hypothetical protein
VRIDIWGSKVVAIREETSEIIANDENHAASFWRPGPTARSVLRRRGRA